MTVLAGRSNAAPAGQSPATPALWLSRSDDGQRFEQPGTLFATQAESPALIRLPNGHLLAMFDTLTPRGASKAAIPYVSRSIDAGRSWSAPAPIRLKGRNGKAIAAQRGALVALPNGIVRLYYVTNDGNAPRGGSRLYIGSAVTRNGIDYIVDEPVRIPLERISSCRVCVALIGREVHLLLTPDERPSGSGSSTTALHYVSPDGRRFGEPKAERFPGVHDLGSLLTTEQGLVAYGTGPDGIRSLLAHGKGHWRIAQGTCLRSGTNPAVLQLPDREFVMVYTAPAPPDSAGQGELAAARPDATEADAATWKAFGPALDATLGTTADAIPPEPDFQKPFDYGAWWDGRLPKDVVDNAYTAYAAFMPLRPDAPADPKAFPGEIDDMFNGEYDGPRPLPFPWDPAEFPNWEATDESPQMQELLRKFDEAAQLPNYCEPFGPLLGPDGKPISGRPSERQIASLNLMRGMFKAELSVAWRAEDGHVDPSKMRSAWATCLRNAAQLEQAPTLIHFLVGTAERSFVESNAREALRQGVFQSADEIEQALDVLRQEDHYDIAPSRWLAGEAAATFATLQDLLTPAGPDGKPRINKDKLREYFDNGPFAGIGDEEKVDALHRFFDTATPEQLQESIKAMNAFYKESAAVFDQKEMKDWSAGLEQLAKKYGKTNALTQVMVSSFGRVAELITRTESSRRATQLTYSLNLFKAKNGRWPSSLDELPAEQIAAVRNDPFSNQDFVYKLTASGPLLYSVSKNGIDDGAVHDANWGDGKMSSDYIFWPPPAQKGGDVSKAPSAVEQSADGEDQPLTEEQAYVASLVAPKVDFANPVDYKTWFEERIARETTDNAYDDYMSFMPFPGGPDFADLYPEEFNDMFNGDYKGPIQPWDPAEHPDWEAQRQFIEPLLDRFYTATRHQEYVEPLVLIHSDGTPRPDAPLLEVTLPALAQHRRLTKATLAEAWRTENGQVSSERMQESIETALRNAQHLESAWTLIHHIVGVGEQQLAQQNALKALEYGVFQTPDQIQSMLTTLQTHDWYDYRNPSWMQGESACYQDAVQYMFTPLGPDGQPTVNTARAMHIFQWDINSEAERQATQARVEALTPDDAYNAIAVADEVARDLVEKWRTGYPDVRAEDLQRVAEKKSHTNIITEQLIPSLGRAYFLIYRSEAARRGTQVAYAANLYHATYGTWPASLEQLDGIIEPQTRIDPFTGNDLGYRVDENGPVIYSVGGNMIDDGGTNTDLRWLGNGDEKKGDDLVFWPTPN